jgi:hypothetical protein
MSVSPGSTKFKLERDSCASGHQDFIYFMTEKLSHKQILPNMSYILKLTSIMIG